MPLTGSVNSRQQHKEITMRKHLTFTPAALLITAAATLSGSAFAASDGTKIQVTGKIVDNTCIINDSGSDLSPTLATVSARELKGKGTTLGKRDVKLVLKDCGKDITRGVTITAKGTPDTSDTGGYAFKNSATGTSAASGIGLRFYKSADKSTPFMANGSVAETVTFLKEGDNTLTFAAAYVATADEPSAGNFNTTVNLTLAYQ